MSYPTDPVRQSERHPSCKTLFGLDWVNFSLADVQTGVGPFLAIYLTAMPSFGWNQETAGLALTVSGIAGILAQTQAGALVDRLRAKRTLIAIGVCCLAVSALVIALFPHIWPVLMAQVVIGSTSSVFIPAIAAISLGLVGYKAFDSRQGRNQMFNSAGNVTAAVAMGLLGYFFNNRSIFVFVAAMIIPTFFFLRRINPDEVDYESLAVLWLGRKTKKKVRSAHSLLISVCLFLLSALLPFTLLMPLCFPCWGRCSAATRGEARCCS